MKDLKLHYLPVKRISVLDYEKNVLIKENSDLVSILKEISPLKAELCRRKNPQFLSLVLRPNIPFRPDPDIGGNEGIFAGKLVKVIISDRNRKRP